VHPSPSSWRRRSTQTTSQARWRYLSESALLPTLPTLPTLPSLPSRPTLPDPPQLRDLAGHGPDAGRRPLVDREGGREGAAPGELEASTRANSQPRGLEGRERNQT
jgi:hypothetical protein